MIRPWPFESAPGEEPTENDQAKLDATERAWRRGFDSGFDLHQPVVEKMESVTKGGAEGRRAQREDRERDRERLLEAVQDVRAEHPNWSRLRIARELVAKHERASKKKYEPEVRERRVDAIRKRIERAESTS